jgi:hypothetical protein
MKAVLAWAGRLAPRVTRDDGVLPEPAKAVLDVFGKVRNRVHRVALDHGLLGAVVAARADEIDVADVEHELGSALAKVGLLRDLKPMRGGDAYTVEDVSAILRLTARGQGVHWITGEGLLESADAWDAKLQDPAWNTARRMKAPPAVPAAVGSSAYDQQLQERAQAEWDRGRAGALPTEVLPARHDAGREGRRPPQVHVRALDAVPSPVSPRRQRAAHGRARAARSARDVTCAASCQAWRADPSTPTRVRMKVIISKRFGDLL